MKKFKMTYSVNEFYAVTGRVTEHTYTRTIEARNAKSALAKAEKILRHGQDGHGIKIEEITGV